MTDNFKNNAIQVGIISAVEIGFGILEGIIMPNIFEREYHEPLFLPKGKQILSIAGGLIVTGVASGLISDVIIANYDVKPENRTKVIIGSAIAINLVETLYSYNAPITAKKKLGLPTFKMFAPAFAVLVTTSILGGNLSDYLISKLAAPGAPETQMPSTELASL